jgi:hypothetical protein
VKKLKGWDATDPMKPNIALEIKLLEIDDLKAF